MKRIYSILLLGAVAMTVTSCFDGNKFLRFFNFGNKPAKEVATEAPAEAAVEAANKVRVRAGAVTYNAGTLTLDELCNERCREMMWEGHRRQDLIRFNRFTGANSVQNDDDPYNLWVLKYSTAQKTDDLPGQIPYRTPSYMKVFPLPDYVVTNGFTQNPGYRE